MLSEEVREPVNNKLPALLPETIAAGFPPWEGKRNIHIFLEGQEVNCRSFGYGGDLALLWGPLLAAERAVSLHIATPGHCKMVTTLPGSAKAKPSQKSLPLFTKPLMGRGFS